MTYCKTKGMACDYATMLGDCKFTACKKEIIVDGHAYIPYKTGIIEDYNNIHGKWIAKEIYGVQYDFCSECGECKPVLNAMGEISNKKYCPNCGTKMNLLENGN